MSFDVGIGIISDLFRAGEAASWKKHYAVSRIAVRCDCGASLVIQIPGGKTPLPYGSSKSFLYDFRVLLISGKKKAVLSHAEIVGYLSAAVEGGVASSNLRKDVLELARKGTCSGFGSNVIVRIGKATRELLAEGHLKARKPFDAKTLTSMPLRLSTLLEVIFWIMIQEELNYPQPRRRGRKLAVERYLEAIHAAANDPRLLPAVIERALAEGRVPRRWVSCDYSGVDSLRPISLAAAKTAASAEREKKNVGNRLE